MLPEWLPAWCVEQLASLWPAAHNARWFTARARLATAAEREPLWEQMVGIFPLYAEYARKTDRVIPIVLLTPQD